MTSGNLFNTLQVAPSCATLLTAPYLGLGVSYIPGSSLQRLLLGSYRMSQRAAMSVPATLCKRCGVLRHTSDNDSHVGVAAATSLPLEVLSVYL